MHQAPAVRYPLIRSGFLGWLIAGVWMTSVLVLAVWYWVQLPGMDSPRVIALLSLPLSAWMGLRAWRTAGVGMLHWDTQGWHWRSASGDFDGTLRVLVDLQEHLWIEWRSTVTSRKEWLWLDRDTDPVAWTELRRAVYSRVSPTASAEARGDQSTP